MDSRAVDLSGRKFDKWTVIEYAGSSNGGGAKWLVRCDCGSENIVRASHLTSGSTKGCRKCYVSPLRKETGEASKRMYFNNYRKSAGKRGLCFNISYDEFVSITTQDCYYCGAQPEATGNAAFKGVNGIYKHNGIDRKDSGVGYVESNIVPCCGTCNLMKNRIGHDKFLAQVARIAERLSKAA